MRLSWAWEWGSTEAGSASSVSDPADVIEGWTSVCFGSAGQLGVGRVEEQPLRGTVEVYGHWGSASLAWERAGRARTAERRRIKLEWKNCQIETRKDARSCLLSFPPHPLASKESLFSHRNCTSASVMLAHEEKEAAPTSPFKGIPRWYHLNLQY